MDQLAFFCFNLFLIFSSAYLLLLFFWLKCVEVKKEPHFSVLSSQHHQEHVHGLRSHHHFYFSALWRRKRVFSAYESIIFILAPCTWLKLMRVHYTFSPLNLILYYDFIWTCLYVSFFSLRKVELVSWRSDYIFRLSCHCKCASYIVFIRRSTIAVPLFFSRVDAPMHVQSSIWT